MRSSRVEIKPLLAKSFLCGQQRNPFSGSQTTKLCVLHQEDKTRQCGLCLWIALEQTSSPWTWRESDAWAALRLFLGSSWSTPQKWMAAVKYCFLLLSSGWNKLLNCSWISQLGKLTPVKLKDSGFWDANIPKDFRPLIRNFPRKSSPSAVSTKTIRMSCNLLWVHLDFTRFGFNCLVEHSELIPASYGAAAPEQDLLFSHLLLCLSTFPWWAGLHTALMHDKIGIL